MGLEQGPAKNPGEDRPFPGAKKRNKSPADLGANVVSVDSDQKELEERREQEEPILLICGIWLGRGGRVEGGFGVCFVFH